jgi:glycosyltransferase involved in cell wall biosynthesis
LRRTPDRSRRVAIVLSHPTQYYSPWFRWLKAHTGIPFRVFYLWDFGVTKTWDPNFRASFEWDVDLLSGYDCEFVPNASKNPGAEHFFGFNNPLLARRLALWNPDCVLLFGYKWASHLRAIAWARLHRIPLLFRGDSHLLGRGFHQLHVRLALRILFSQFASFLYVGEANRRYFEAFGVPSSKLFFSPHSVDETLFDRGNPKFRAEAENLRTRLGLSPSTTVVLFAGKLVAAKQPLELLRSFLDVKPADAVIIFVGDGPEKEALELMAADHATAVRFLPFANQSEMPSRYLLADLFVLPSRGVYETWGLAVNEAMHMGVPCLVSDRVGCHKDLVTTGETGWVFDSEDQQGLSRTLSIALDEVRSPPRRAEIRSNVERRMAGYTYERTTDGLLAALSALSSAFRVPQ